MCGLAGCGVISAAALESLVWERLFGWMVVYQSVSIEHMEDQVPVAEPLFTGAWRLSIVGLVRDSLG